MLDRWLFWGLVPFLAVQGLAVQAGHQNPLIIAWESGNGSGGDDPFKVPGKTSAHFVGNPKDDILEIGWFDDKIMNRFV